jgi:predicted nuclease with TOPRIM domain
MTESQILGYPDFDALLLAVAPELKERAATFGEHIENGRRQAAESAQSNRAAKDAKLNALADEVQRLKDGFRELYNKGLIDDETLSKFVAE